MNDFWYIPLKNGNEVGIDKGKYNGNLEEALEKIKNFCANTDIKMKSHGHGYGNLTITKEDGYSKKYEYNPYGIDIDMMLGYIHDTEIRNQIPPNEPQPPAIPAMPGVNPNVLLPPPPNSNKAGVENSLSSQPPGPGQ